MATTASTALVLAAGGARGAYQAGALAELLPALEAGDAPPRTLVGESVGALNAVVLAGHADAPADRQAQALLDHWASSSRDEVLTPLWRQLPEVAVRYAGEALGVPGLALRGLLGVGPLHRLLERAVRWDDMHRCIAEGALDAVGLTATAVTTGRSVTFVERARPAAALPFHPELDYAAATIGVDHVLGSAAIPLLFPPRWVDEPTHARGWYVDGSTRLHTPLRPALDLGADRIVVVGTTSIDRREPRGADAAAVDIGDTVVTLLHAMVEDSLRRDIRRLTRINAAVDAGGEQADGLSTLRRAAGRPPYRAVPCIVIAPEDPYEIGDLAVQVFRDRYGGWRAARDPDVAAVHHLLGGDSPLQGEALSFLLFAEAFHGELIRLGRRDARRWLDAHDGARFVRTLDEFVGGARDGGTGRGDQG